MVRRLGILVGLICAAGAALAPSAGATVSATDVCAAQPGHGVERLVVRLQFHADPASHPAVSASDLQKFGKTFAVQAETLFNGHGYTVGGSPLALEVDTSVLAPGDSPAPNTHQIAVTASADARSGIAGLGKPGAGPLEGEWSLGYIGAQPQVGLHEIGHLLGLQDQYKDVLADWAGHEAPLPRGITFNNDGSIVNKDTYRDYAAAHGLDFNTMKGESVPFKGHEHDIMATTKDPKATFEPSALKSLSAFAHHCDPPQRKLLVPVFPQLPTGGCVTADEKFHPITTTSWPELSMARYRHSFKAQIECPWQRELAAERSLVDYSLQLATAAGEVRTEQGNTCDINDVVALGKIWDQLYTNARNVAGEVAARDGAVIWSAVRFRAGYTSRDGFRIHTISRFGKNLKRTFEIESRIAGAQFGSCTSEPGT
ncbi:MAG: hypothetical protein ACJ76X_13465 [Solirubrobacteraceae bacterium]